MKYEFADFEHHVKYLSSGQGASILSCTCAQPCYLKANPCDGRRTEWNGKGYIGKGQKGTSWNGTEWEWKGKQTNGMEWNGGDGRDRGERDGMNRHGLGPKTTEARLRATGNAKTTQGAFEV